MNNISEFLSPFEEPVGFQITNQKIMKFLHDFQPPTPCLIIDLDVVEDSYRTLNNFMPLAKIYYAIKANPESAVILRLAKLGSNFDLASRNEIQMCLDLGIPPGRLSFGNTIKKESDIEYAYENGIRLFAFDSEAELEKLSRSAPKSNVFCRILVDSEGADWPLSRKFGCHPDMAVSLLKKARNLDLNPVGVSFHPGSQQKNILAWDLPIKLCSEIFKKVGGLKLVNIGGGLPANYRDPVESVEVYTEKIQEAFFRYFGNNMPEIIIEPGRSMVGNAGIMETEVVLISKKNVEDPKSWVYVDISKFTGLAETADESIKYRIITNKEYGPRMDVIIAGCTCDSLDILFDKSNYQLPMNLTIGDKLLILSAGAYSQTYGGGAGAGFNGFERPKVYCI